MNIYVDLGTSRTALAIFRPGQNWVALPTAGRQPRIAVRDRPNWRGLRNVIVGAMSAGRYEGNPVPHWVYHSRYCSFDGLVVPINLEGEDLVLPAGARIYPADRQEAEFSSLKDELGSTREFLGSLYDYTRALLGTDAQWIIGRSSGASVDPKDALSVNARTFNEAVAVIFALITHDAGSLLAGHRDNFVVLADLGGGFLDICVADRLHLGEDGRRANIVNYGGYPLGVDRIGSRFSTEQIINGADTLRDLIALAIRYHIWDYRQRSSENEKKIGVILLTGGGFKRMSPTGLKIPGETDLQVEVIPYDTKYLTLLGLQAMNAAHPIGTQHPGEDITRRMPQIHGLTLVDEFANGADWAGIPVGEARASASWFALLDNLRRRHFERSR